jgi:hypothetical protein
VRRVGDSVGGLTGRDTSLDGPGGDEDLGDREPAAVAGAAARRASASASDRCSHDQSVSCLGRGGRAHAAARIAQTADEPLRDHALHGGRDLVGRDADVDETGHRARSVVRVQRRQHEVPGERCLDRDFRGLAVANLADEDDVRVLPHDRPEGRSESQPGALAHLHLHDARDAILDRVLDGHHIDPPVLDLP